MKKITIITIIVVAITIILLPKTVSNQTIQADEDPSLRMPSEEKADTITEQQSAPKAPGGKEEYKSKLTAIATTKGLSEAKIREIENVIACESTWNTNAVGDYGTSFGLVQIHLPAHPHITSEQAMDPKFALNFIVDEFLRSNEWKWTCHKMIYGPY
jgi:hypothetical protein